MRLVGMKFEILSPLKCLRARNFRNFQLENLMEIKLTKFDDSTVFTAHLLINFAIIISIFCGLLKFTQLRLIFSFSTSFFCLRKRFSFYLTRFHSCYTHRTLSDRHAMKMRLCRVHDTLFTINEVKISRYRISLLLILLIHETTSLKAKEILTCWYCARTEYVDEKQIKKVIEKPINW